MVVNPLNHPVYHLLPQRTQKKILSPISEDKLTWDCFVGLKQAKALGPVLADSLAIPREKLAGAHLVLWGWEIHTSSASKWAPLSDVLSAVEDYRDGRPEGQKTEPDVIVFTESSLLVIECKRHSRLGTCSRFKDKRCPEIDVDRRKRPYCQYWARGLNELVAFPMPVPMVLAPECDLYYQLMRNYMIGLRLAEALRLSLHLMVVKAKNSPHFVETDSEVNAFNSRVTSSLKYVISCWNDLRYANGTDLLSGYASELPPKTV